MTHLDNKVVAELLKEVRKLNYNFQKQTQVSRYNCKQYAEKIGIKEATLRVYMMKGNKGDKTKEQYLPYGVTGSGRLFWVQEQVDKYWGAGL